MRLEYGDALVDSVSARVGLVRCVLLIWKVEKVFTAQTLLPGVQSGDEMKSFDTSVIIKPRRVYKCHDENLVLPRKKVYKDQDGNYHCSSCHKFVEDVTDTETGHDLMEVMGM